ncbi:unnamed protein product [Lactuca saligna]|uniref:Uncharacterized protein n=1 Tax=Lactuca saligna TaxID=75948 RepID=A0AA35ZDN1_LACSI|nr:unnamed protein product [Lactuca saligna]
MDEAHEDVKKIGEEAHDVVEEPKEEEVELQVPEDMSCIDEDIATLNGNDDDKEDIPVNIYDYRTRTSNELKYDVVVMNLRSRCLLETLSFEFSARKFT